MKIVYTYDIMRPQRDALASVLTRDKYLDVWCVFDLMKNQIQRISEKDIEVVLWEDGGFDAVKFFELAGCPFDSVEDWAKVYHLKEVNKKAEEYLCSFFRDAIVIGYELSNLMMNIFTRYGINYINMTVHPVRFLDDIFLMFCTNNQRIFEKLLAHRINENSFYTSAGICTVKTKRMPKLEIVPNSAVILGQTKTDASVCREEGSFASLYDYEQEIEAIKAKYSKVYFKVHPYEANNEQLVSFMQRLKIDGIGDNFYQLVADERLKGVYALSSSAVAEAKYFNKNAEFLYKSAFDIVSNESETFGHLRYIGVYSDCYYADFWEEILSPVLKVENVGVCKKTDVPNRLRDVLGIYWAYDIFMPEFRRVRRKRKLSFKERFLLAFIPFSSIRKKIRKKWEDVN